MTDPNHAADTPASQPGAYSSPNVGGTGKKTLSLVSMITGIVGVVLAWTGWGGVILGLAAVVLGHLGQRRERAAGKAFWLTGLITGYIALALGIIFLILGFVALAFIESNPDLYTN